MTDAAEYHPLYLKGITAFNECDFFEAHDFWEELWTEYRGESRDFYKGLIQSAVCLHHFGNGNIRGAKKLYFGSRQYLEKYLPGHLGLELQSFLDQMNECCAEILASEEQFPKIDIEPDLIPEIHLDPSASLPDGSE